MGRAFEHLCLVATSTDLGQLQGATKYLRFQLNCIFPDCRSYNDKPAVWHLVAIPGTPPKIHVKCNKVAGTHLPYLISPPAFRSASSLPHRIPLPPPAPIPTPPLPGFPLQQQNKAGQTAGHYAVSYQFFDFSEWLFLQDGTGGGADDTIENTYGLGPYDGLQPEGGSGGADGPLMLEGGG